MDKQKNTRTFHIGEIYLMNFDGSFCEQNGMRPGLVIQNNVGNTYSPNVIALPLTSCLKKVNQPTHVLIKADESGLIRDSVILCENPECIAKEKIGRYLTTLSFSDMSRVAEASLLATSVIAFLDTASIMRIRKTAAELNSITPPA